MDVREIIKEILYLVQHSTGIRPTVRHLQVAIYGLNNGIHPLKIKDALIMMIHKDSKSHRLNSNLRSCDW